MSDSTPVTGLCPTDPQDARSLAAAMARVTITLAEDSDQPMINVDRPEDACVAAWANDAISADPAANLAVIWRLLGCAPDATGTHRLTLAELTDELAAAVRTARSAVRA